MVGSMAAFTFNDSCMKQVFGELPFFQAILIRSIFTVTFFAIVTWQTVRFRLNLNRGDWLLIGLRTLGEVGAAYFFLTALANMPIANVTAVLQVLPLSVTLAAAIFLREPVGWRRIGAIVLGGIGVMIIIRPGPEGFNIYAVYAVIAVACVTLRDLSARRLGPEVPSVGVSFITALGVLVYAAIGATTEEWVQPSGRAGLLLAGATCFIIIAYQLSVMVMRIGDIAFVSPFRYSSILVALLVGFVIFDEWPDALTLLGVLIVVAAGTYAFLRERQRSAR